MSEYLLTHVAVKPFWERLEALLPSVGGVRTENLVLLYTGSSIILVLCLKLICCCVNTGNGFLTTTASQLPSNPAPNSLSKDRIRRGVLALVIESKQSKSTHL